MNWMLALSVLSLIVFSCGKRCPCPSENIIPYYVAYTPAEIDTIEIRRFAKGSNFSQSTGTTTLTAANATYFATGDTTSIISNAPDFRINDEADWEIFNPCDNKLIRISEVLIEKQITHCGGLFSTDPASCFSMVTSFKKNGTVTTLDQNSYFRGLIIKK
ncbi:MAG TPA: hypothetical protein VHL77_01230 [Ferruginibacter sp.]|jgi:hypothetical protein|nr:hypothetical protein [Ferruginibacter sp.]